MKKQNIEKIALELNINANVISNKLVEVAVYDEDGDIDKIASFQKGEKLAAALKWNGFKNGWGGFTAHPAQ